MKPNPYFAKVKRVVGVFVFADNVNRTTKIKELQAAGYTVELREDFLLFG